MSIAAARAALLKIWPKGRDCEHVHAREAFAALDEAEGHVWRIEREHAGMAARVTELEAHAKRIGTACAKHDLVGGWACPVCLHEAREALSRAAHE